MIRLLFHNPADSPTGKESIRLRFSRSADGLPCLHYSHGTRTLTRDAWSRLTGARIVATSDRDARIVLDVLGIEPCREN